MRFVNLRNCLVRCAGGLSVVRCCYRERERTAEDEEEIYEKRKIERKIREKEATYQEVGYEEHLVSRSLDPQSDCMK